MNKLALFRMLAAAVIAVLFGLQAHAEIAFSTDALTRLDPSQARVSFGSVRTDRRTGAQTMEVNVTNLSGQPLSAPLYLAIEAVEPPTVGVIDAPDISDDDPALPYFTIDEPLPAGASLSLDVTFRSSGGGRLSRFIPTMGLYLPVQDNRPPVADAGTDRTVQLGATVTLDGSASSDADNDLLTFRWTLQSSPPGSGAALSDTTAVKPTLVVDVPGSYMVQLVVNDGFQDSAPDTVTLSTDNVAPVAEAGDNLSARVGDIVVLDGSGSRDADGDLLTFAWSLLDIPADSTAVLSDPAAVGPSLAIDLPGSYVVQLIVNDGQIDSAADTVVITTDNTAPVANAGQDQTALLGQEVTLDGSQSGDVDGDPLTFAWSFVSKPAGSTAILSDGAAVQPTFVVDLSGTYVVRLVVSDGQTQSQSDAVVVSTLNSTPRADAGQDVTARVSDVVVLDGTGSSDPDADLLGYAWTVTSKPQQSAAILNNPATPAPSLTIDWPGTYVIQLVVSDGQIDSEADEVVITTANSRPVADPGEPLVARINETVELDGTGSSDPDFDPLAFNWSITAAPTDSSAVLADAQSPRPSLVPDAVGSYVIQLIVSDGTLNSQPRTVTVEVLPPQATLVAAPLRGGIPLEVAFSVQMAGGFPPYSYQWDIDGDSVMDDTRASFVHLYQVEGSFQVKVTVTDDRGYLAQAEQTVEALVAPVVVASASPTAGSAPLDVTFSAVASDPDGAVVLYEWDFNGDGAIDERSPTGATGSFRYTTAGRYQATLTVTDDDGITSSDRVVISVGQAPQLTAAVTPLSGDAPLAVTFTASAVDPDGSVVLYEWDFEGDGIIDYSDPASGDTTYTYSTGGIYPATVSAYDDNGLLASRSFVVSVAGPPTALPRAFPLSGQAPLTVTFFSDGVDIDGSPEYYDWDFDGNGVRDIRLIASMNTAYTYTTPGVYTASLTVEDDDGLTGTDTVTIEVLAGEGTSGTPQATAMARPDNGGAPLTVFLVGQGVDSDGLIVEYAWDFDSDGVFERVETVSADTSIGQLIDVGSYASPELVDLDADGDRDLLIGNSSGQVLIYTNIGLPQAPLWGEGRNLVLEDGSVLDVGSYGAPVAGDMDGDGDRDLLVGDSSGRMQWVENTGTGTSPLWSLGGFLADGSGATLDVGSYAQPLLLDYDGDGDRDLLVGNSSGQLTLYLRSGTAAAPVWSGAGLLMDENGSPIDVGSYAAPLYLLGSAGTTQLLVGDSSGRITGFVRSAAGPSVWQNTGLLQTADGNSLDVGSYATPIHFDLFGDGVLRLLVGNSSGQLAILTETATGWELTASQYDFFDVGSYADPVLADLDGDLDLDLMVGNSAGEIYLRRNIGSAAQPAWGLAERLRDAGGLAIDIGSYAAPALGDIDGDGDIDLLIGDSDGRISQIRNDGDAGMAVWMSVGPLTDGTGVLLDVGSRAAPLLADLDRDGDLDLLVGTSGGQLVHYRNDGDPSLPVWTGLGSLMLVTGGVLDVGSYAQPTLFDGDGNGTLDLLIGNSAGVVLPFENSQPAGLALQPADNPYDGLDVGSYAAPTLGDIDNDGDADLLIGNSNGLTNLYRSYGQVVAVYPDPGVYQARLRVTDDAGLTATATTTITVLSGGSPTAQAMATPVSGSVPLAVQFDGRGNDGDGSVVSYEWDFDGDGTFDYSSASGGQTSFTYTQAGNYDAVLRVTDDSGLSAIDTLPIRAEVAFIPAINTVSFDPANGEEGIIQTVIDGAQVLVTIRILDGRGQVVRTLVESVLRGPGTYQDPWSGTDQNGAPVVDGPYYVVVEYRHNGETTVIDSRQDANFEELTPSRSFSSNFNPYEGQPVTVSYQIPWPAEVSLYFWTRDNTRPGSTIAPVRTLFLRQARPAGSYTDIWDGFDDNGVAVASGQQYPVTLWLYRLPDNVILVTGNRPEIPSIAVEPAYLTPAYNPYSSTPPANAVVTLNTTKTATLEAQVVNGDGLVVRRISRAGRPAGLNTLTWDGRDAEGNLVAPGTYSIGVVAIDSVGNRSLPRYAAVTVQY